MTSVASVVNFKNILHLVLQLLFMNPNKQMPIEPEKL